MEEYSLEELEEVAKVIDFRKVEDKCGMNKMEAFQTYIISVARPGEVYKVVMRDADNWLALRSLGEKLGYKVLGYGGSVGEYYVYIMLDF